MGIEEGDTVRIGDLLNGLDSTVMDFIKVMDNGKIYACYSDSVINAVVADDILGGLADVSFESNNEFELPVLPPSPVPIPIELPLDDLFTIPFEYEGYEINFVKIKSGKIFLNISSNFTVLDEMSLMTDNIKLADGSSLELSLNIDNDGYQSIEIDLTDCEVIPVDGSMVFSAYIKATYSSEGFGGVYNFNMNGGLTDIHFKSIDGAIQESVFLFEGNHELNFNFPNLYGDLKVATPEFSIKYVNSFGFSADALVDSLYLLDAENNKTSLVENWEQIEILLKSTGGFYDSITELDDAFIDEINILDDYNSVVFKGNVVLGCDDVAPNMIADDSHIDVIADLLLPLEFDIQSLSYIDTLDFNLSLNNSEDGSIHVENIFDELEFKFVFENALPVQIMPQMYVLEKGNVIDSLFNGSSLVHGCFDGTVVEDVLIVSVTDEKLINVQRADQLIMNINLSSLGNNVMISKDDYFKLRLGLKTRTSEINVDDFNF